MNTPIRGRMRVLVVGALLGVLLASPAPAHEDDAAAIAAYLHGLVEDGALSEPQHRRIDRLLAHRQLRRLARFLDAQEQSGALTHDTRLYLNALLGLGPRDATPAAVAPAAYSGNGNVALLGRLDPQPPSSSTIYNGIWGYAVGAREYALQCNSYGLHILDVTDPGATFQVQFIDMSGGQNPPLGRIWRDVDVHRDPGSGKTYAYVAAQSGGNFWVVDLSFLSGGAAHGVDSNPIPPAGIADRGRTDYGHTLFVNDGLLFLNSANNGSTLGCQIFDLLQDPFNPPLIAGWSGSGHDCHDSYARTDVGGKDLLFAADGYATRYRVLDISNVRFGGGAVLRGESAPVAGIYAHSNWLSDDARTLYAFEEANVRDIGIYDVSNPSAPAQLRTLQYSGDVAANSRIHNGQVRGNYLLTAYYEAGFRVFDISNPRNPVEVGKYETWRDPDGDGVFNQAVHGDFEGAWNLHAFLPSGRVLVSDMKSGTFVFRVDPVALPGAPGGLSAVASPSQVMLAWSAPSGATGYSVKRGTGSGGPYTTLAANQIGTSFIDAAVSVGVTYFYVVTATNAAGEGAASAQASATPGGVATSVTLRSIGAQDGWVRESRENRGVGGLARGRADTPSALRVGDDAMDRQLASIVAFDTAALPDGATILSATLRLRRGLQKGTPFGGLGACRVDVRAGGFSGQTALEAGDFEAASDAAQVASLNAPAADGDWAEGVLDAAGLAVINRTGTTQMRVRFARDDDDDRRPDFVGFRSGDDADAASRPQLVISYR